MDDLFLHTAGWDNDLVAAVKAKAAAIAARRTYLSDMLVTLGRLERFMAGSMQEPWLRKSNEQAPRTC
ncbi:MAG: hypothetical protein IPP36_11325 [Nitrosomonadales bacterium]|nr:hypothetical protein [Nitrosomonadales bacterium]